jgi:Domain of unknown function (DUF4334)
MFERLKNLSYHAAAVAPCAAVRVRYKAYLYPDKASTAHPVHDHFKKIDDHAVMGILNGKNALDNGRYAYLYLERV